MDIPTECVRFYLLRRHNAGVNGQCIFEELATVHGEAHMPALRTVYSWIAEIREGTFGLSKKAPSGRPKTVLTDDLTSKGKKLVKDDPRRSVRILGDATGVATTTIFRILTIELQMQKLFSTWVSHELTPDHKTLDMPKLLSLISATQL